MGNVRTCLVIALAACGNDKAVLDASMSDAPPDAKVYMDAPAAVVDLSCTGNPAPTAATATITLSGTVQSVDVGGATAINAALVEACRAGTTCNGQDRLDNNNSNATGNFTLGPMNTNSMPLDVYLRMSKTSVRTMHVFPPQAMQADQAMIPIATFGPTVLGFVCSGQNDANNGVIVLAYFDCMNQRITDSANLVVEVKQGGVPVAGATVVDLGAQLPQAAGTYIVCNVPANNTTSVGGTYKGTALLAHNVRVVAGTSTSTLVRPGYF